MRKLGFTCFWMIIVLAGTVSMGTIALADDEKKPQQEAKETDDEDTPQTDTEKSKKKELELKACGESEVNFSAKTDKKQHPRAEPQADKAIVYVIRPTSMGNKVQSKLALDGKWLGSNRGNNYFYFTADPGDHYFCSKAENRSVLQVNLEAGKTYYLQQKIQMGFMKARNKLVLLTEEEGTKGLEKCHLSIAEEKQ